MSAAVAAPPGIKTGRRAEIEGFFRSLLLGDFEDQPNTAAHIVGGLLSLIPVLDQVMDARDITACLYRINKQGGFKNATPDQVVNLAFAAIGAIPELGSVFKTVFKPLWRERHLASTAVNSGVHAIEAMLGMRKGGAIGWIHKELLGKWPARTQAAIESTNSALDACIALADFLGGAGSWKNWLVPASVQTMAASMSTDLRGMRSDMAATIQTGSNEIRMFLSDIVGEKAAEVVMAAGERAVQASARPGARSNAQNRHNAADPHTRGKELPRQNRKKTQGTDTSNTDKGSGGAHSARQVTRDAFGKTAHMATGLIGEHMVDYYELGRLGGSFTHDVNTSFKPNTAVAKLNADKRPVNLTLLDMPKMPLQGIDAVWEHDKKFTVTEAKARGSIFAVTAMAQKFKTPAGITSLDDKMLYALLSTSKAEEGDGKTLVQMSADWVRMRAGAEKITSDAEKALEADLCDRRVVLVTFESDGASDHAQALAEIQLECDPAIANRHTKHGKSKEWNKSALNKIATEKTKQKNSQQPAASPPAETKKRSSTRKKN